MTKQFFEAQMSRLMRVFGRENYPAERVKLIFEEVHDLSSDRFEKIITHFIGTSSIKWPPLVPAFREAAVNARREDFRTECKQSHSRIVDAAERSGEGLREFLDGVNANNLVDAMKKVKGSE